MLQENFHFTPLKSFESEVLESFFLAGTAYFITGLHNATEDDTPEPIDIILPSFDYLVNDFRNLLHEYDHLYPYVHKNLAKIQEFSTKLNSIDNGSFDFENLAAFMYLQDLPDGIEIDGVMEQMDIMLTQKEHELHSFTSAIEGAFVQKALVGRIDTLKLLFASGQTTLERKQNKHFQREYTESLGILSQCSSHTILQLNLLTTPPIDDEIPKPRVRGLPEEGTFGSVSMHNIAVMGCHRSLVNLSRILAVALFPGAIAACCQLQSCVDMTVTEDIRRLRSLYALDWDPLSRCFHLLADHEVTVKATVHIATNGSVSLVTITNLPNSDQYQSCNFIPPISWSLDEWMMEINDFCHSIDF